MEIIYKKRFVKELVKLPAKIQSGVKDVLDKLKKADSLEASGVDYKLMKGQKKGQSYYRIRVGSYRIGIEYVKPDIIVVMIASRGDVYKTFPPQ